MEILIGSDLNGFALKEHLKAYLSKLGHTPIDMGVGDAADATIYPDVAIALARRLVAEKRDRGILICGTGIGMAMTANKVPGARAACAHDPYSAERARKSNDAQILTLGAQIVGSQLAETLLDHWLASEFQGGRSTPKVDRIKALDEAKGG